MIYNPRLDGVTQSIMYSFMKCPKAGLFSVSQELDGAAAGYRHKSVGSRTFFGSMFHDVMETCYTEKDYSPGTIETAIHEYNERNNTDTMTADQLQECEIESAKCQIVAEEYFRFYPQDCEKVFLFAEKNVETVWNGYRLRGKIDGIYRATDGSVWRREFKTRGRIADDDTTLALLSGDFQNQMYELLYNAVFDEKSVGTLYEIIRNPGTKPDKRTKETVAQYMDKLRAAIQKQPEYYFKRYEVQYTDADRKQFEGDLIMKLARVERLCNGREGVYGNHTACAQCDFLRLCALGDVNGYILKPLFVELAEKEGSENGDN